MESVAPAKILVVDDEPRMRALLVMAFESEGFRAVEAPSAEAALEALEREGPAVLVTDIRMPGLSGLDLVKEVKKRRPHTECIVMTAFADARSGVEAMKNGALEYLIKPFEMDEMLLLVKAAAEKGALRGEVERLKESAEERFRLERMVGDSAPMLEMMRQARMVAKRDTTVLIRGKSGTGKELVARGIHAESGRQAFIAINCGALPENLLETELFGHEKGAFTGAHAQRQGIFERAGKGTVFLDEIGDITPSLQVKLLRVLQEREFTRVGGSEALKTAARVITATNRNLEEEVAAGHYREDLYYRLNVFPLFLPSLNERAGDIPSLCDHFLAKFAFPHGLASGVAKRLQEYAWPGNVRELENCLERAAIMAGDAPIELRHLPENIRNSQVPSAPSVFKLPEAGISLDEVEKNLVLQALEMAAGNKTRAAGLLGISRRALYSKMHTHDIRQIGDEGPG